MTHDRDATGIDAVLVGVVEEPGDGAGDVLLWSG